VSILQVRLNKQLEEPTKDRSDKDFGEIVSEKVYSAKKKVRSKNGRK